MSKNWKRTHTFDFQVLDVNKAAYWVFKEYEIKRIFKNETKKNMLKIRLPMVQRKSINNLLNMNWFLDGFYNATEDAAYYSYKALK